MTDEGTIIASLEQWGKVSIARLSPLVGVAAASTLTESMISEAIGPLVDARLDRAPRSSASEPPPSYSEITEFFRRFSPDVVLSLSTRAGGPHDLAAMIEIRDSVCAKIVSELPVTLGAYGRGILAVDWRTIVDELPQRTDAMRALAAVPGGRQIQSSLRKTLDDLISGFDAEPASADGWLRIRFDAIERLRRLRPAGLGGRDR